METSLIIRTLISFDSSTSQEPLYPLAQTDFLQQACIPRVVDFSTTARPHSMLFPVIRFQPEASMGLRDLADLVS